MSRAYYNENDPRPAAWLRELIKDGLIAPGDVDTRDIRKVKIDDLKGYSQVHLFAGIGGWSLALRLAGVPDDFPVWTGSCPCQPFSAAGKQKGTKDARHLWPWMRHLIFRGRPAITFGEQVASSLGRQWLAGVRANLETLGYVVGAADLCAAGVSAPHIRQRLFWVADAGRQWVRGGRFGSTEYSASGVQIADGERERLRTGIGAGCDSLSGWLGSALNSTYERLGLHGVQFLPDEKPDQYRESNAWSASLTIQCRDGKARRVPTESAFFPLADGVQPDRVGLLRGAGNAIVPEIAAQFVAAYLDLASRPSHGTNGHPQLSAASDDAGATR